MPTHMHHLKSPIYMILLAFFFPHIWFTENAKSMEREHEYSVSHVISI